MFGKWIARERRRHIRTRYLIPAQLTPTKPADSEPLPAFLLELWDTGAAVVVGQPLVPRRHTSFASPASKESATSRSVP